MRVHSGEQSCRARRWVCIISPARCRQGFPHPVRECGRVAPSAAESSSQTRSVFRSSCGALGRAEQRGGGATGRRGSRAGEAKASTSAQGTSSGATFVLHRRNCQKVYSCHLNGLTLLHVRLCVRTDHSAEWSPVTQQRVRCTCLSRASPRHSEHAPIDPHHFITADRTSSEGTRAKTRGRGRSGRGRATAGRGRGTPWRGRGTAGVRGRGTARVRGRGTPGVRGRGTPEGEGQGHSREGQGHSRGQGMQGTDKDQAKGELTNRCGSSSRTLPTLPHPSASPTQPNPTQSRPTRPFPCFTSSKGRSGLRTAFHLFQRWSFAARFVGREKRQEARLSQKNQRREHGSFHMTLAAPFPLCSFNTVCPALTICDIAAVTALLGPARPGDLHPAAPPGVGRSSKQHVLRSRGGGAPSVHTAPTNLGIQGAPGASSTESHGKQGQHGNPDAGAEDLGLDPGLQWVSVCSLTLV